MKTEKEKMLAGELYDALDPQLSQERQRSRDLCKLLNDSREEQQDLRRRIIDDLFGYPNDAWIQPPFFCDYGTNIVLGEKVFFNFNCVILDVTTVKIGNLKRCIRTPEQGWREWSESGAGSLDTPGLN